MTKSTILITGAMGEVGHSLINYFLEQTDSSIVTTDLNPWHQTTQSIFDQKRITHYQGDITDPSLTAKLFSEHNFDGIFHLAAILSSGGEKNPVRTHQVNVNGTLELLELAQQQSLSRKIRTKFMFPSTIAIYGVGQNENPNNISENQCLNPIPMYGANKLYIEHLGRYYSNSYKFTTLTDSDCLLDFRAVRYPGLLSSETVPTGGTSDYASEMIHSAAQNKPYECFVSQESTLPFMTMPDAISALTKLYQADSKRLTQTVYNVSAFSVSAAEIAAMVKTYLPNSVVTYKPHAKRQTIVTTWPNSIDDSAARKDWDWNPKFNFEDAFAKYLIPNIKRKYNHD